MRQLFRIAVTAAIAGALALTAVSCEPEPLDVAFVEIDIPGPPDPEPQPEPEPEPEPEPDPQPDPEPEPEPEPEPVVKPVVAVYVAPGMEPGHRQVLCEDEAFVVDAGLDFVVTAGCDDARVSFSMESADTGILSLERTGVHTWIMKSGQPGRTWLRVTAKDALGRSFEYEFLLYVFGHITIEAEYHPIAGKAGLTVQEHPYTGLTAGVYLSGQIFGWPWNDPHNVVVRDIPSFTGTIDITNELDHWDLVDASEVQEEIQAMSAGSGLDKAWFAVREAELNYVICLSNPYVIIDALVDDTFREETKWWDFYYEATLQQDGIGEVENPETVRAL